MIFPTMVERKWKALCLFIENLCYQEQKYCVLLYLIKYKVFSTISLKSKRSRQDIKFAFTKSSNVSICFWSTDKFIHIWNNMNFLQKKNNCINIYYYFVSNLSHQLSLTDSFVKFFPIHPPLPYGKIELFNCINISYYSCFQYKRTLKKWNKRDERGRNGKMQIKYESSFNNVNFIP